MTELYYMMLDRNLTRAIPSIADPIYIVLYQKCVSEWWDFLIGEVCHQFIHPNNIICFFAFLSLVPGTSITVMFACH